MVTARTIAAVPKDEHACRATIAKALPCDTTRRSKPPSDHEAKGPIKPETPIARIPWNTMSTAVGVVSSANTHKSAPAAKSIRPR